MYDVITVGSATIDVFAKTDRKLIKKDCYCFPMNGKVLIDNLEIHTGGGGTNVAFGLAKFGLKTAFLGKFGCKDNSQRIIKKLNSANVACLVSCEKNARTAFSIIIDAPGKDRTILVFKGSANNLRYDEIEKYNLNAKWFYFCSMTGDSYGTLVKLAKFAEEKKISIAFNPSSYMIKKYNLKPILARTNVLIFNRDEARMLTGEKDLGKIMKAIYKMGPRGIVITDGPNKIHAYDGDRVYTLRPKKVTKIIETTGAGDAFGAGFLAGLIKTNDFRKALKIGNMNSEGCISQVGAKEGLLSWKDVKNKI
ncbi:MAG: carbohydrate kinase family protein [Nanoarchaeota archaeon]|nr:carbohydrate kinase family protein [Nanoarchaeota archaeon]